MRAKVVRTGISVEPEVLRALDRFAAERNAGSRSDAVRFLVRSQLAREALGDPEADAVATVMVLYRHRAPKVLERLTEAQHRWGEHLRSTTHVHLEGDLCLEVMILAGHRGELRKAAEDLRGVKGISQGEYVLATPTTAGGGTGHHHPHAHRPAKSTPARPPLPVSG
jgi:CopG family nickel-responsive transcriptional regulator